MRRMLRRPLTVADMASIKKEMSEELLSMGKEAAAQWKDRRRKKPGNRKGHAPKR